MRGIALVVLGVSASVRLAPAQVCPDGTPPPCPRAAARPAAPLPAPGSRQRPFTIVAEFDGTAPAEVRAAARNLVSAALDESAVIAALPDEQIRLGLTLAGKPETTRVDVATARELAVRGSVRTVMTGTIDQVGQTYHATVRVLNADSGAVVESRRDIARGADDLIPTLDWVVRALRVHLGERHEAIAANRRLEQAATPSFAAYQQYRRGMERVVAGDFPASVAAYKAALALDPGFAAAWRGVAAVYFNMGMPDSARAAIDSALAHPGRLADWMRLYAEGNRAGRVGDASAGLAAYIESDRLRGGTPMNSADALSLRGRFAEAAALWEQWERSAPFGLRSLEKHEFGICLLMLGRVDDARRRVASVSGDLGIEGRLWVATWTADWPAAESLATRLLERSAVPMWRIRALLAQASVAAARGRVREAVDILRRCSESDIPCSHPELVLRVVSGLPVTGADLATVPAYTDGYSQLLLALWATAAGDTAAARGIVTRVGSLPPGQRTGTDAQIVLVEAWLEAAVGRSAEVVRLLRPLTERGTLVRWGLLQQTRWTLADAYEHLGQPDSAAAQLERLAEWQGASRADVNQRGLTHSFAHQRLVILYARMGRPADARRHWQIFSTTFTSPDPEMQHFVDEARAALASVDRRN